jgi:TIR domain
MNPGERIRLITEAAELLAKRDASEQDLILGQFGMNTTEQWDGDAKSYAIAMIQYSPDDSLRELHQFLTGHIDLVGVSSGPHPWKNRGLRLFMSHLAKHQGEVGRVAFMLAKDGIDAFVAHTSIDPSLQWQDVIESALRSCDAMAVFLHDGFRESDWCDQEVGFAMSRNVPVLPLRFDLNPYGFMGKLQAENCSDLARYPHYFDTAYTAAWRILAWLHRTPTLQDAMTESLVSAFESSNGFDQTSRLFRLLEKRPTFERQQLKRLREAAKKNSQVRKALLGGAPDRVENLVARHGGIPDGASSEGSSDRLGLF